ncbi:MAG: ABC transporter permease [Methanotrichaceae archaeon]
MFEWAIAKRHILGNPKMVLFTVISLALAVGVIMVLMGITEGYRENIISNTIENNPHITVEPKEDEDYIYLYETVSKIIWKYSDVQAVSPRLKGKAAAKHKDNVKGVSFIGVDPIQEDRLMKVQDDIVQGDYYDLRFKKFSAIVGTDLANDLDLKLGDDFYLTRHNISIKVEAVGFIETGTSQDQYLIYLPLETTQDLLGEGDVVSEVGVKLSDIYVAPVIVDDLKARTNYEVESWQDLNRDILDLLDTQSAYSHIFYVLIFIISGFGIANTMIMMISRRTKEIGILMAMGSNRASIMKIFIMESVILGPPSALLGGLLACVAAALIGAYNIELPSKVYMVSKLTVAMTPEIFAYAAIFALLVNFVAGIYPAYKASNLDPVEAIASE